MTKERLFDELEPTTMNTRISPWIETVDDLKAAGFEFTGEFVDIDPDELGLLLVRIIRANFDIQVLQIRPHQTRREIKVNGLAPTEYRVSISPGGRGFHQR